jgi:hypothetical protein
MWLHEHSSNVRHDPSIGNCRQLSFNEALQLFGIERHVRFAAYLAEPVAPQFDITI